MCASQIAVELERMLALGEGLRRAFGEHVDETQPHMAESMIGHRRQGFVQASSAAANAALESATYVLEPLRRSARAKPMRASTLSAIGRQRRSKKARALATFPAFSPWFRAARP